MSEMNIYRIKYLKTTVITVGLIGAFIDLVLMITDTNILITNIVNGIEHKPTQLVPIHLFVVACICIYMYLELKIQEIMIKNERVRELKLKLLEVKDQ